MGEDKGKGRAHDVPPTGLGSHKDDQGFGEALLAPATTIFSKAISSATGLAISALSAPTLNETISGRAALLGNSKSSATGGDTAGTSAWAQVSRSVVPNTSKFQDAPVKSDDELQHVRQMESDFLSFLDGTDRFTPDVEGLVNQSRTQIPNSALFEMGNDLNSNHPYRRGHVDLTVADQEALDGQDVIALLNGVSALDESMVYDYGVEDYHLQLTLQQIAEITSISKSHFPPETSLVDPLRMRPDPLALDLTPTEACRNEEYAEVTRTFLSQWDDVLSGYTDEVWGNLLPLVREARQEVEVMKNRSTTLEIPTALRRLGQIFNHLHK